MSLIQFLRILMARKSIVLSVFLSCLLISVVVSLLLPPRYEGHSRVMLEILKPDPVTGQVVGSNFLRAYIGSQVELIKDTSMSEHIVDELGWANDPTLISQFNAETGGEGDIRTWLAQRIAKNIDVKYLEGSNILDIVYTADTREAAKQFAEVVRKVYLDQAIKQRRESAAKSANWYRDQTEKAKLALDTAVAERTAFARQHGLVVRDEGIGEDTAKLQSLAQSSVAAVTAPSQVVLAGGNSPAQDQLEIIDQQIAQAATTLGPNHPAFQALQRQKAAVQAIAGKSGGGMSGGRINSGAIENAYQAQKARVIGQQDKVDQLERMRQEIAVKRDTYAKTSQRMSELRLEAETNESGLSVLGPPSAPESPSFPNVPLILASSIAFGLGFGVFLALLVELLNRRVRSDQDLEAAAEAPVFAMIGEQRDPDSFAQKVIRLVDRRQRDADDAAAA